ncbi:50S ribosome-binding GTPase [Helicobacter pylori]|nr:50S ribosome-binding GTPase [Helicobacter pylori]
MKNIYLDVKANIENLQNIFKNTDNENERLKKSNQEALEVFQKLEFESLKELESLKNNEEWENFTIAFYGETGAGKSTLIECLRLFFKEQSKVVQQERFKRLYSNYQNNYQNDERKKQAILNELHSLQDGAIIGDGRSDFTTKTRSYTLKHNNKTFTLLDVPGIEGSEKKVIQQFLTLHKKPMLFFMLPKSPPLRKKEKREKKGRLKKSKNNSVRKQRYGRFLTNRLTTQELSKMGLLMEAKKKA